HEEAIRLQEQFIKEERQRIARDAEITKQLQEAIAEADSAHDIDWNDPAVIRYHALQNRYFYVAEQISKEDREKKDNSSSKPVGRSRKKTAVKKRIGAKLDEESSKKQKLEVDNDAKKEELRAVLDIVLRDDIAINDESLATKYPIVDWKTHILIENMMYYQIIRADGSSKNYKIFNEMLDDFDRQDVIDLHKLVQKRRLEVDHESEMAFELLRFTKSQLKE
nr:hypothetical protein [Tanacetum cinerariifolium]